MENAEGLRPELVSEADFTVVRRGYEPGAVRRRLRDAAAEIERLNTVVGELSERLADLEAPPGDLEAERVAAALGDEAARVLQAARDAAQDRIERAEAEGEEVVETARAAAAAIVEEGRDRGRAVVQEAKAVRERILTDLARKRRTQRVEVEQLRTVRDRLLESLSACQAELAEWVDELVQVVPQARAAAQRAGLLVAAEPEPTARDVEAEIATGRLIGIPLDGILAQGQLAEDSDEEGPDGHDSPPDAFGTDSPEARLVDLGADYEDLVEEAEQDDDPGPRLDSAPVPPGRDGPYDIETESSAVVGHDADEPAALAVGDAAGPATLIGGGDAAEPAAPIGGDAAGPATLIGDDAGESEEGAAELEEEDTAGEGLAESAEPAAPASDADAIFARLRVVGQDSAESAPEVSPSQQPDEGSAAAPSGAAPSTATARDEIEPPASAPAGDPAGEAADAGDLIDAARAVAVGEMARQLKRIVVDEQGELLDGLRRLGPNALETAVRADPEQYARAVRRPMEDFASDVDVSIDDIDLQAASQAVVSTLVEPTRDRLTELGKESHDIDELSAAVRAVYRESRSSRADAAATEAFAKGWHQPVA